MTRGAFIKKLLVLSMAAVPTFAGAQAGSGNIRILVGFPAGGAPDSVARAFADQLRQSTGAVVIVENRVGASGKIAIDQLLSGSAQGDTVALMPSSVLVLVPLIIKSAKYDAIRDFTTLGTVVEHGLGIAAGPATPATNLASYQEWARRHPQQSSYATPGVGTPQHFLGVQLAKALGVNIAHVPYKGGAAAVTDVIGGQVPLLITTEQLLVPHEAQGKLKTLLVTSPQRNPKLPNAPTAREAGLPQLESTDWFGIFGKAGMPAPKVAEWRSNIAKVVASQGYKDAVQKMGYTVPAQQPTDFTQLLSSARKAWTERVKLSGFTAED